VLRDLVVERSAFDRIVAAGGYVTVRTGSAPEANAIPVAKPTADRAMEAAACIGCGACVAACPNASAALFTGAKISHLGLLPQGQPERPLRVVAMASRAQAEGFGHCTSIGECEAVCPAGIRLEVIARMNRDFLKATLSRPDQREPVATPVPRTA
jgi:succinate dehydrogenase / fumarate reductase iron-sulfur subunit